MKFTIFCLRNKTLLPSETKFITFVRYDKIKTVVYRIKRKHSIKRDRLLKPYLLCKLFIFNVFSQPMSKIFNGIYGSFFCYFSQTRSKGIPHVFLEIFGVHFPQQKRETSPKILNSLQPRISSPYSKFVTTVTPPAVLM